MSHLLSPRAGSPAQPRRSRWYGTVWRWHFYAGLFCIPFVVWLALTGSLYLWRPQVEALLDQPYDRLTTSAPAATAGAQLAAAIAAVPGATLRSYVLPDAPGQAVRVLLTAPDGDRRVYLDPHAPAVLGVVREDQRPFNVLMRLHGELLAGTPGSVLVELAACWAIVMLLTGLYLWWPRGQLGAAGLLYPRLRRGPRLFWRDLHAVAGLWVSVLALALIVTGLPWAAAWGRYLGEVRTLTGTTQGPVDWTIGGRRPLAAAMPEHAGHGQRASTAAFAATDLARVVATAPTLHLASPVLIAPPARAGVPWTVSSDTADRPLRAQAQVDGATGRVVGRLDFADRHWIDRIIGYGIAAHEGALFGLVNQIVGTLTALLLIVLAISGAVLWWRRRPAGLVHAPWPPRGPRFGVGLVATIVLLGLAMPLFGATLLMVLAADRLIVRRRPGLRRWLGLPVAA